MTEIRANRHTGFALFSLAANQNLTKPLFAGQVWPLLRKLQGFCSVTLPTAVKGRPVLSSEQRKLYQAPLLWNVTPRRASNR
jgi:hypothetical protein